MNRITLLCFCVLMTGSTQLFSQQPTIGRGEKTIITAVSPTIPVLKRAAANAVVCIKVYIPNEKAVVTYKGIRFLLDDNAVKAIDKLDVIFNGAEPLFSAKDADASINPVAKSFTVPVSIAVKAGWNYIWISAVLKDDADISKKFLVKASGLVEANNRSVNISQPKTGNEKYAGIALRKAGDDNVNTYRIPGLATTDKGTLIAVYDIRYKNDRDLPANIDVGLSRSTDGGKTWQPMKIIMDMGAPHENNGVGDPAVLFDPVTKKIWVAALWSKGNRSIAGSEPGLSPDTTGQFVLVSSDDDGLSWSAPVSITAQVKNPRWHLYFNGPGNGIAMQNGTIVFASQYWDETKKPGMPHSSIVYSDDHGKTWKSGIGAKSNTTESQVVETTPGTLMLNMRDNRGSFRSIATTKDMGKNWIEHSTSYNALPDPVCMGSIIKAKVNVKGQLRDVLFFSNVSSSLTRKDMTIKASLDRGETWLPAHQLLLDERRSYGYSCLTKIDDNTLGILYEGVKEIYFVRVPVSDIIH